MTYIQTITSLDGTVEVCLCASCTLDLVDQGVASEGHRPSDLPCQRCERRCQTDADGPGPRDGSRRLHG